jgi:hypothetical protein
MGMNHDEEDRPSEDVGMNHDQGSNDKMKVISNYREERMTLISVCSVLTII